MEQPLFAFVLMPFDKCFDDLYRFGIKDTAASLGITAERVDEQMFQEGILDRIHRQIAAADIVIAEMTGHNPNVFYEVGYAHGLQKVCVLLTTRAEDIPFDLKHQRHIVHEGSIQALKSRLTDELEWAKREFRNVRDSHIRVVIQSIEAQLTRTRATAAASVTFTIDLLNESDTSSADIHAVYFYSSADSIVEQDGRECPRTDADLTPFGRRHFLAPPLRMLPKRGWAQLQFTATKTVASRWNGDELRDSYRVTARNVLRLVTSAGHFDYEVPIDVTADEIPF